MTIRIVSSGNVYCALRRDFVGAELAGALLAGVGVDAVPVGGPTGQVVGER